MQSATLTLSMHDYTKMQTDLAEARREAAAAREEVKRLAFADPTDRVTKVAAFARDCLTLARFAVANCPPEMIRGWPYQELRRICETIDVLPDYSINDRDMAIDLLAFAKDCEEHEIRRRAEPRPTKLTANEIAEKRRQLEESPIGQLALGLASRRPE